MNIEIKERIVLFSGKVLLGAERMIKISGLRPASAKGKIFSKNTGVYPPVHDENQKGAIIDINA